MGAQRGDSLNKIEKLAKWTDPAVLLKGEIEMKYEQMMIEEWPLLATLCVLVGYTVYSLAQRQSNENVMTMLRHRGNGVDREGVHEAVQAEVNRQTELLTDWENEVRMYQETVGNASAKMGGTVSGIESEFGDLRKKEAGLNQTLADADSLVYLTSERIESLAKAAEMLDVAQGDAKETNRRVTELENEMAGLSHSVTHLANHMASIFDAVVDEEAD